MVDESFHLTPVDVRRYDFGSALRGYDKVRVDQFRDQVAAELERLTRINMEMEAKARGFHEQLRAFRERDKALSEALVTAQQIGAQTREQAEREAQLIIREAKADGERAVEDARAEIRRLQATIESLERMRRAHVAQLRALVQRHLAEIDATEHLIAEWPDPSTPRADAAAVLPPADEPPAQPPAQPPSTPASPSASGPASPPASTPAAAPSEKEQRSSAAKAPTPTWLDASVPE